MSIADEIKDLKHRTNRLEAILDEMFRSLQVYAGDKRYDEQEKQKLEKLRSEKK